MIVWDSTFFCALLSFLHLSKVGPFVNTYCIVRSTLTTFWLRYPLQGNSLDRFWRGHSWLWQWNPNAGNRHVKLSNFTSTGRIDYGERNRSIHKGLWQSYQSKSADQFVISNRLIGRNFLVEVLHQTAGARKVDSGHCFAGHFERLFGSANAVRTVVSVH